MGAGCSLPVRSVRRALRKAHFELDAAWASRYTVSMKPCVFILSVACCCVAHAQQVSPASQEAWQAARELTGAVRTGDMSWMVAKMYPPVKRMLADELAMQVKYPDSVERARAVEKQSQIRRTMMDDRQTSKAVWEKYRKQELANMAENDKALEAQYRQIGEKLKKQGMTVESFQVSAPYSEYLVVAPSVIGGGVSNFKDDLAQQGVDESRVEEGKAQSRIVVLPTMVVYSAPDVDGNRVRMEKKSYLFAIRDERTANESAKARLNKWFFLDASTDVKVLRSFFPDLPLGLRLPSTSVRPLPAR